MLLFSEAGKLALNLTKVPATNVVKRVSGKLPATSKLFPHRGKKVITIRADQLINMTKEKKVIIQTGDKKFRPNLPPGTQPENGTEIKVSVKPHNILVFLHPSLPLFNSILILCLFLSAMSNLPDVANQLGKFTSVSCNTGLLFGTLNSPPFSYIS